MNLRQNNGFKLVELIVVTAILAGMMGGIYMTLTAAKSSWAVAETQIQIQDNLRQTLEKIFKELRESGTDQNSVLQVTISDGTGVNNSDVIKFSIPVLCHAGMSVIDVNGNVAYWGAPLTWGCTTSSCMDSNDDCAFLEYKYIQYQINNSNQLVRLVLGPTNAQVRQDIIALNITDFQAALSADQHVVTLTATATAKTLLNRQVTTTSSLDVYLRNRGG